MYLDKIHQSSDVKSYSISELQVLAKEIRWAILERCSNYGGHVGSNLGIVELVIALHYVYDLPKDKLVFDVSHQMFAHKILTGRGYAFTDKNRYEEIIEFSNPKENETDIFHIGHTSTSIGLATGLAKARDVLGRSENIVAVIGDASMGGGQAFEGLNTAAGVEGQLLIVLNDNEMSVFDNQGSLYSHFKELRETSGACENNLFKLLGFDYKYVEKGNDLETLVSVLNEIKVKKRPTVIHVHTRKGLGYAPAEIDKARWHYSKPFNLKTGEVWKRTTTPRENYGNITFDFLSERMQKDKSLMVVAASTPSCFGFYPERVKNSCFEKQFIDVGIEEQNALLVAAGIARNGGKVFFGTWASFYQRAYDQISQEICLNNLPVTMLVTNASILGDPNDTHAGIYDIGMLSSIPRLLYMAPAFKEDYLSMLRWCVDKQKCPVAIRIPWHGVYYANASEDRDWSVPKYNIRKKGCKVALLALGGAYHIGEDTSKIVEENSGISCTLIDPCYANKIDKILLDSLMMEHELVVTIEDAAVSGGFGAMIAQYYSESRMKVKNYGFFKELPVEFDYGEFMKENCMTAEKIAGDILSFVMRGERNESNTSK